MGSIPPDVKITLEKIKQEFMRISLHWRVYSQIFRGPKLQIEMLNMTAPAAFVSLEVALRNEILMSLSRLSDKAKTGRNKNLTFDRLQKQIEDSKNQNLLDKLSNKLAHINERCKPIRELRNKLLAHLDADVETTKVESPNPLTVKQVKEAIKSMQDYLIICQRHYEPEKPFGPDYGEEGELLIRFVRDGLRLHELIHREGKVSHTELEQGRWKDVLKKEPKNSPGGIIFPHRHR